MIWERHQTVDLLATRVKIFCVCACDFLCFKVVFVVALRILYQNVIYINNLIYTIQDWNHAQEKCISAFGQ